MKVKVRWLWFLIFIWIYFLPFRDQFKLCWIKKMSWKTSSLSANSLVGRFCTILSERVDCVMHWCECTEACVHGLNIKWDGWGEVKALWSIYVTTAAKKYLIFYKDLSLLVGVCSNVLSLHFCCFWEHGERPLFISWNSILWRFLVNEIFHLVELKLEHF